MGDRYSGRGGDFLSEKETNKSDRKLSKHFLICDNLPQSISNLTQTFVKSIKVSLFASLQFYLACFKTYQSHNWTTRPNLLQPNQQLRKGHMLTN